MAPHRVGQHQGTLGRGHRHETASSVPSSQAGGWGGGVGGGMGLYSCHASGWVGLGMESLYFVCFDLKGMYTVKIIVGLVNTLKLCPYSSYSLPNK